MMNFINKFNSFNEAVNFFEKGKFWTVNGKKVRVVGSIPQNPKVLKFQEVDESGKPIGKVFVGNKGDVKGWKPVKTESSPSPSPTSSSSQGKEEVTSTEPTKENPEVLARYKELILTWKENQKKLGKNTSPGEGTRSRLMKQAESEVNFDETKDVDTDIKNMKSRPAVDVIDRVSSLVKSKKVKNSGNIVKYLDFVKNKIQTGMITQPSMN